METKIVLGRSFEWRDDAGASPVAIVNETAARAYWPGRSPVGRRIRTPGIPGDRWIRVVGVLAGVYSVVSYIIGQKRRASA